MQQVPSSTPATRGPLIASSPRRAAVAAATPETSPTSSPRSHHLPTRLQEPSTALLGSTSQRDHVRVPIAEAWEQDPFASINSSGRPSSVSAESDPPILNQPSSFRRPSTQSNNNDPFQRSIVRWSQHYQHDSPASLDDSPRRDHSHVDFRPKSQGSIDDQEPHEDTSSAFRFAINPFRSSSPTLQTFADRAPRFPTDEKTSRPHRSRRARHPQIPHTSTPPKSFRDRPLGKYIAWFLIVALVAVVVSVTVTLSLRSSRRANSEDAIGSIGSGVTYSPPPVSASSSSPIPSSNQAFNALSASAIFLSSSTSNVQAATALLTAPSSAAAVNASPTTTSAPSIRAGRASSTTTTTSARGKRMRRERRAAHP
ncbi:BZ3500_MvSof-1268-A1-R1_Chr12-3g04062 [Microbotryum saponariae]|uniref:BZ3500_MvSof-1268-A1-R1_Chr12-3g04062 protein n=1 Tax=Microbotryum saponariae TaxID=289078 RepID=A0A2X0N603_9BASI|nr:BZ3500_MvSof-1268-A1-R1_Chr12-3g04062 [Microbotryum saponariae]SDA02622.1 BZ3501_MvSof-1269-A2-R1_Chr12-3g03717 [Microbotryum saponariae]